MKRPRSFKEGDKVFAKIKGYPAWPAVVTAKSGKKYSVKFYGTDEKGFVKPEELYYYLKHKESLEKGSKKKEFKDALEQISKAVAEDGTDGDDSNADEGASKRKRSNSEKSDSAPNVSSSAAVVAESDAESIISESPLEPKIELIKEDDSTNQSTEEVPVPEEAPPVAIDVKIISELNLKMWIVYGDRVKGDEDLYKSLPPYTRNYSENQVLPVNLSSGLWTGLKFHKTWPISFETEYDCAIYDHERASELLQLKESVLLGESTPETNPDSFLTNFEFTATEVKRDAEIKLINSRFKRVERLRNESKFVELDAKIKNSLGLNKADPKKAIGFLSEMLQINMDELMLKKHSHVVEMIRRLRRYIGNTEEWNLSQSELDVFLADSQQIRSKAEELYKKLKSVVTLRDGATNFWEEFDNVVKRFRDACKKLSSREIFTLIAEPYSRDAIIDRLEEEEEMREADISQPTETEKENLSEAANSENPADKME